MRRKQENVMTFTPIRLYSARVRCRNCGVTEARDDLLYGRHLSQQPCAHCGCISQAYGWSTVEQGGLVLVDDRPLTWSDIEADDAR